MRAEILIPSSGDFRRCCRHGEEVPEIQLYCPRCQRSFAAADLDLRLSLARCACGSQTPLAEALLEHQLTKLPERQRRVIAAPDDLYIEDDGFDLSISYRWANWKLLPLAIILFASSAFMFLWHTMMANANSWLLQAFAWSVAGLHLLGNFWMVYALLCGLFNGTIVTLARDTLTVRHGPLPTTGNLELQARQIEQLYASYFGSQHNSNESRKTNSTLSLYAILRNGDCVELLRGLATRRQPATWNKSWRIS